MTILKQKNFEASLQDRINNKLISISNNSNQIDESIAYALSNPGKRVRPLLVYLVGDALNRWNAPQKKKPEQNIDNLWGLKGTEKYWEHVENFGKVLEKKDKEFWKEDKGKK